MKVMAGPEKKSRVVSERARRLTAYHESGHAIASFFLKNADPVHYITIIPRGAAGGFTSRSKSAMPARVAKLDAPPTASAIAQKATYGRMRFHLFNLHHLGQDQDALVYVPPSCKIRANRGKLFALF